MFLCVKSGSARPRSVRFPLSQQSSESYEKSTFGISRSALPPGKKKLDCVTKGSRHSGAANLIIHVSVAEFTAEMLSLSYLER